MANLTPVTTDDSITPENLTGLSGAHQAFVDHLKQQSRSTSTVLAYGKDIQQLVEYCLREHHIEHAHLVEAGHLDQFKEHLSKKEYTAKSISRKINSIKSFFRFLKAHGHLHHDPADQIKHPKYEIKSPRVLTKTEYRALRDACRNDDRTAAIVETLLQTGIRIGELANLKLEHLQSDHLIIEPYESQPGRIVPLNKAAKAALDRWLAIRQPTKKSQHLFTTKNGRPLLIRNIRTSIDRYFKLAGIDNTTVNDLRHTWIAHHLATGASLVTISKIAGHKRLSTTGKYLQFVKDQLNTQKVQLEEL